ncbi:DUF4352 domain-containing protein [Lactiplantibacillus modestisalitolerans]|uniref:DUF4352 domain-containing protein n=1 Tax=Lactiplantibacillus modestisalitolerans TaxID=1457219 RepID=A0ABV5WRL9_9LACO|nr:DUF4352 domain-containing protein [Lactiplantibacillus modestisalitolerans]
MKTSLLKKWWIWVLAIVGVFLFVSLLNPADDHADTRPASSASKKTTASSKPASDDQKVHAVGEAAVINGVELKVNKVDKSASENAGFSTPKTGNQYYQVNVTLTNKGAKEINYNPLDFKIKAGGNMTDFDEFAVDDDNRLETGSLTKGGTVTGNIVAQAPTDGTVELIYTPSFFSEKHLTFKLQ